MECSRCGTEISGPARFCANCGTPIDDVTLVRPTDDPELLRVRTALGGRYRIESLLGRGGMGSVYKAYEPTLDRYVAIKVVPQAAAKHPGFVERFRREARLAAKLRHPQIASVFEVGEVEGIHYFAMDYIEGETLRSLVRRRGPLPASEAIPILKAVSDAVAHAHRKGIIHRDLKPENVMIGSESEIFVMDFGLARGADDPSITASGTVMGTPLYMSPEQLAGEPVDERSDVFALGLVLYFCLTGENLFEGGSVSAIVARQLSLVMEETIRADGRIPDGLRVALLGALQRDRDARTPTAGELSLALSRLRPTSNSQPDDPSLTPTIPLGVAADEFVTAKNDEGVTESEARRRKRLRSFLDNQ